VALLDTRIRVADDHRSDSSSLAPSSGLSSIFYYFVAVVQNPKFAVTGRLVGLAVIRPLVTRGTARGTKTRSLIQVLNDTKASARRLS
jgi:hypothetical protein